MIFPKMTNRNNRYRGPLESEKEIKSDIEARNAVKELSTELNKLFDMYDYLIQDNQKNKYLDYSNVANLNIKISGVKR